MATSQVFLFQYLGGAVFIAVGETIFTNSLRASLHKYAPNVNVQEVIEAGATAVRSTVSHADLHNVLKAYNHAIIQTFVSLDIGGRLCIELTHSLAIVHCRRWILCRLSHEFWNGLAETAREREAKEVRGRDGLSGPSIVGIIDLVVLIR